MMKRIDPLPPIDEEEPDEKESIEAAVSRRNFLSRLTATGLGVTAFGVASSAQASGLLLGQNRRIIANAPNAMDEKQFRQGLIGPIEFSLATSKIAMPKAVHLGAREFAGFELAEAVAVKNILQDLETPTATLDAKTKTAIHQIKNSAKGDAFDIAYITAQMENHLFLRDLADNYLKNSSGKTNLDEVHTRHLAALTLAVCNEHMTLTRRIWGELVA